MTIKSLNNLLQTTARNDLSELAEKARKMVDLSGAIASALPEKLAGEVRAANVREDGELVVIVGSSPAAARMRFENEELLEAAQTAGYAVSKLTIRVARQA